MNVKIKYLSGYLKLKIPEKIRVVNSLPDKIIKKLDSGAMRNILNKSLRSNKKISINFKNKKIAIIIEDVTRPIYLGEIVKILIEELMGFGVKSSSITIIAATGAHRIMKQNDFEKKRSTCM